MKKRILVSLISLLPIPVFAHHGVASLGAAGLEGPGAPLETSSSATLPEGSWLFYGKVDYVKWKKFSWTDFPDQKDEYYFWTYGIGYGVRPYLSVYTFIPYYTKKEIKDAGRYNFTSSGFADISFIAVFGYKYDKGFRLVPKKESLDDMMDWHFTTYGGFSISTGDYNGSTVDKVRNDFEADMATGFGKPCLVIGQTATKQLVSNPKFTILFDGNYTKFYEKTYNYKNPDGSNKRYKYGDEIRINSAITYRVLTDPEQKLRFDTSMEATYQYNFRDKEDGIKVEGSGGKILYGTFGGRLYYKRTSLGIGIKLPVWKKLNEDSQQQGGEGKEKYRIIITFSALF
jgi:hypothetical protein